MSATDRTQPETAHSPAMQRVFKVIERVATSDLGILITGEFGTGKLWLARRIHQLSLRAGRTFSAVDCSMLFPDTVEQEIFGQEQLFEGYAVEKKGFLEEVNGGTLYLGNFPSLPVELQLRFTRVVEHQKFHRMGGKKSIWFNARVILAARGKQNIAASEGVFLKDVYRRLTPIVINLPLLRERQDDILPLVNGFIKMSNQRNRTNVKGISPEALKSCLKYSWPGNIRELQNAVEYTVIMAQDGMIQPADLPLQIVGVPSPLREEIAAQEDFSVHDVEKRMIERAIREAASKKEAARLLGITVKTLYDKLNKFSLNNKPAREKKTKPENRDEQLDNSRELSERSPDKSQRR
ncbi:MAG: sigma 54-interacting transcriptional regulator [Bacteroidota bacterium]